MRDLPATGTFNTRLPAFSVLCRDTLHALRRADELLVNWHETLVRHSQEATSPGVRGAIVAGARP